MSYKQIPVDEKSKRHSALRSVMQRENIKLMLFTATAQIGDKRGKGSLPYLFGYNLNQHRIVYASFPIEGTPTLIFPNGVSQGAKDLPVDMYRSAHGQPIATEIEKVMLESKVHSGDKIGIVGFDQQMPIPDYLYLKNRFPGVDFFEATELFDEVRAIKSRIEHENVRKSNLIAEKAFKRLVDETKQGASIREIASAVFYESFLQGAHFYDNSMLALWGSNGQCTPYIILPDSDYKLQRGDVLIFSIEVTSQEGYWVELARIISLGKLSETGKKLADVTIKAQASAADYLRPGETGSDVYNSIVHEISKEHCHLWHTPGHSIGLDVSEGPAVKPTEKRILKEGMVIAVHPHVVNNEETSGAYISDTFFITEGKAEQLSKLPSTIYEV